jgi:hypothetical protein
MRSLSGATTYAAPSSASHAPAPNQSARGPGRRRSAGSRERTTTAGGGSGQAIGTPTGSTCPAASRGGPTQARVSVEREPSTGSTVIPPATAT